LLRLPKKTSEEAMTLIHKPLRIEPAFEDREAIRAMFRRHAPYRAIAASIPDAADDSAKPKAEQFVQPWFRGNWAAGGEPLVEGVEAILRNKQFLEAAKALFGTALVFPEFVVVNVNAPMPAGMTHVDIPAFHGATRRQYPLSFLRAMGSSGLFEKWRVIQAGAVAWFYEGAGGAFDYWPEGRLDGPMVSVRRPFGNVALMADNDRMYHRIGPIGDAQATPPRISSAAQIQPAGDCGWAIVEDGEVRAAYPDRAVRLSLVWKAEVRDRELRDDILSLDRVMAIFTADLRRRSVGFDVPSNPLADDAWLLLLQRTYLIQF
jgi:hypothetical protein